MAGSGARGMAQYAQMGSEVTAAADLVHGSNSFTKAGLNVLATAATMPVLASSSKAGGKKRKIDISGYERASNSLAPPIRPAARRTQVPPDNAVGASSAPTSTFFAILGSGFNQGTTVRQ
jgi:hypothetical protein